MSETPTPSPSQPHPHRHRHPRRKHGLLREHSLSISTSLILIFWITAYKHSDPSTHLGSFFGNAIADWSGVLVTIFATKYLYEKNSKESRPPPKNMLRPTLEFLRDHGLSIFLLITGAFWVCAYIKMDANGRWGQVVGNIVSEWTQILGLVIMTKHLMEKRSKE